ncbi:SKN1-domain-containing protein [Meira miltonrushii]|uniref:SKN1-domain-containing protein n=1 Tax=Meira miltonrushii TaxID=1280837 RepID=A0A316VMN4_9BASI|nr:SKN1-domain-containing protein [Meira miltonrushii]PWN38554.1 SKN1-domain-containing protein [Meira miltonrushii]
MKREADDDFHDPTKETEKQSIDFRGCLNIATLVLLAVTITVLFLGYPVFYDFYIKRRYGDKGGFMLGGANSTGQVPDLTLMHGLRQGLIDRDTPKSAYTKGGFGADKTETWELMFSDEFNTDGRSFYPGEDPFWEAVNLYAHGTGDLEWYDPSAVMTKGGALVITATNHAEHNLNFTSGQVTSWNKFCFTGGYLEASIILPGDPTVSGWWPAVWTMGNLGRANYAATTEGTWPYSYNSCDRGTLINQTDADGMGPEAAIEGGDVMFNAQYKTKNLSWQPGQRLSACTCTEDDHPGPVNHDGSYVGRSAPEIDLFEAQVGGGQGSLSLSCQFMPASDEYKLFNSSGTEYELGTVNGKNVTLNSYEGSVLQMAASAVAYTNQESYQNAGGNFSVWGVEYLPGPEGYSRWYIDGEMAWTLNAAAVGPDPLAGISQRPIPDEPMYIIMNLAISQGFGYIDWKKLVFPATMQVDYIRVYQAKDKQNLGCDPLDRPTLNYINKHWEAYTNPNLTIWGGDRSTGGYGANWPRCDEAPRKYPGRLRPDGITEAPYLTVPEQYRGDGNSHSKS